MLTPADVIGTAAIGAMLMALVVWIVPRKREP